MTKTGPSSAASGRPHERAATASLCRQAARDRVHATRDGVRLDADVYRPEGEGPFPVLLMRQPYGRAIASTVVYAHPRWYARHGYIVVIQDVRGRGTSEGVFSIFEQEVADGHDTLDWVAELPGSSGAVGMYGFSYQGMAQLMAAAGGHPALRTICPAMYGYDVFADIAYEGGAFKLQSGMSWALQLSVEGARRAGDEAAHQALFAASRSLPLTEALAAHADGARALRSLWSLSRLGQPAPAGPLLGQASRRDIMRRRVKLPALHIGGWYDGFLTGTLARLSRSGRARGRRGRSDSSSGRGSTFPGPSASASAISAPRPPM